MVAVNGINGVNVEKSAFISVSISPITPLQVHFKSTANTPQHIISYPVISDSINTVKQTALAQKSLQITNATIDRAQPLLAPFYGPYNKITPYVIPYLTKVDSLGDSALNTLDVKVPAVKKPTNDLYVEGKSIAFFPLTKAFEGKDYVFKTFNSETKKVGGNGVVTYGKAAITTTLIVSSDALAWVAGFAAKKKAEAKEVTKNNVDAAEDKIESYADAVKA